MHTHVPPSPHMNLYIKKGRMEGRKKKNLMLTADPKRPQQLHLCTSEDLQTSASGTAGKSFCASQSKSESFGSVSSRSVLAECGEQLGSMSNEFLSTWTEPVIPFLCPHWPEALVPSPTPCPSSDSKPLGSLCIVGGLGSQELLMHQPGSKG